MLLRTGNLNFNLPSGMIDTLVGFLFPAALSVGTEALPAGAEDLPSSLAERAAAFLERLEGVELPGELDVTSWWRQRQKSCLQMCVHAKVVHLQKAFGLFAPREPLVRESPFSLPDGVIDYCGASLSSSLLWHAAFLFRIQQVHAEESPPARVLEIGGGYGGLARLLLGRYPGLTYVIVDLPESIYYQYCYLGLNFPGLRILLLEDAGDWPGADLEVDLAVNTASLQEMSGRAAGYYTHLIEQRMKVRRFYSVNYFIDEKGIFPELELDAGQAPSLFAPDLDRDWSYRHFDINPLPIFLDAANRNWLEMVAERTPRTDARAAEDAARHYRDALALAAGSVDWFREIWSAVRIDPRPEYVEEARMGLEHFMYGPTDLRNAILIRPDPSRPVDRDGIYERIRNIGEHQWLTNKLK